MVSTPDVRIRLPEKLDEDTIFPEIQITHGQKLQVDLQSVRLMNSFGIRNWNRWLLPFLETNPIEFIHVPMMILSLSSIVRSVFPQGSRVESFYVHYRSSKDDEIRLHFVPVEDVFHVPEQIQLAQKLEIYELDGLAQRLFAGFPNQVKIQPQLNEADFANFGIHQFL